MSSTEKTYYDELVGTAIGARLLRDRHGVELVYSETGVNAYENLRAKEPWWEHVDKFTYKSLIGDVTGKAILDLGCGEGRICELLSRWGARKVVGLDISGAMISQARSKNIPNCEFSVGDSCNVSALHHLRFDIVTTNYVIQYLGSYEEVLSYIQSAYSSLRPGGLFCGMASAYDQNQPLSGTKPVMNASYERESLEEYSKVWTTHGALNKIDSPPVSMFIYSVYPSSIQRALKEVGFVGVERRPMLLSEKGRKYFTAEEVSDSLSHLYVFVAHKPA